MNLANYFKIVSEMFVQMKQNWPNSKQTTKKVRISIASDTRICTKPSFWTELLLNSTQFKVTFLDESLIAGASSLSEQISKLQISIATLTGSSQDFIWNLQVRSLYSSYFRA